MFLIFDQKMERQDEEMDHGWSFVKVLRDHYWISRGCFMIGCFAAWLVPLSWVLLPLVLLVDLFVQNPILPQIRMTVRGAIAITYLKIYMSWINYKDGDRKIKKTE